LRSHSAKEWFFLVSKKKLFGQQIRYFLSFKVPYPCYRLVFKKTSNKRNAYLSHFLSISSTNQFAIVEGLPFELVLMLRTIDLDESLHVV
jgi:hypothetical protein